MEENAPSVTRVPAKMGWIKAHLRKAPRGGRVEKQEQLRAIFQIYHMKTTVSETQTLRKQFQYPSWFFFPAVAISDTIMVWHSNQLIRHALDLAKKKKKKKTQVADNTICAVAADAACNSCWCRNNKYSSSCDKSLQIAVWRSWDDKWLRAPGAARPLRLWHCQDPFSWPGETRMRRLVEKKKTTLDERQLTEM